MQKLSGAINRLNMNIMLQPLYLLDFRNYFDQ